VLPGAHALLPGNHDASNDAESDLRKHKPEPVDALVEQWIDDSKNAVKQTRPQEGRDQASQQNRPARKHGKHCAVEKADDQRGDQVDGHGDDERIPMKYSDLPVVFLAGKKPAAKRFIGYQTPCSLAIP